jgi:capsular polysaccharide export protein
MSDTRTTGGADRRNGLVTDALLRRVRHLRAYFPDLARLEERARGEIDVVLSSAAASPRRHAEAVAGRLGAVHWLVQDGLIRSVGGAGAGAIPISLIADAASGPERLRALLASRGWETPALLADARDLIRFKQAEGLSRINGGPAADWRAPVGRPRVLVVDRVSDEPWLGQPPAGPDLYSAAIEAARREHPTAHLLVRRDPGAGLGASPEALARAMADAMADPADNIMSLIQQADAVYVVDSLIGLDALLCGRPVTVFGQPFYAGLGLTDDRADNIAARTPRSLEALFAAAYMLYPRYVDPLTGQACDARVGFERLAAFRRHADRVRGRWVGLNIPPAKQPVLKAFLAGPQSSFSLYGGPRPGGSVRYANWASWPSAAVRRAQAKWPGQVVNIEDGFLRSVGLGSSFHPASSLVLDHRGVYYDPRRPSELEHILNTTDFTPEVLEQARTLRAAIVQLGLSKYNLQVRPTLDVSAAGDRLKLLVPGQVEGDASVIAGGESCSNLAALQRVRRAAPDAYIVYKEHPDVTAGNRRGRIAEADANALADLVVRDVDIIACVEAVDEIHTLTSLTGFEALLRGKPVVTYGWPFYAGWGLTIDRAENPGPTRRVIGLDALVAGALMAYPLYLDPISWLPCDALTFVDRIGTLRASSATSAERPKGRILRLGQAAKTLLFPPRPPAY